MRLLPYKEEFEGAVVPTPPRGRWMIGERSRLHDDNMLLAFSTFSLSLFNAQLRTHRQNFSRRGRRTEQNTCLSRRTPLPLRVWSSRCGGHLVRWLSRCLCGRLMGGQLLRVSVRGSAWRENGAVRMVVVRCEGFTLNSSRWPGSVPTRGRGTSSNSSERLVPSWIRGAFDSCDWAPRRDNGLPPAWRPENHKGGSRKRSSGDSLQTACNDNGFHDFPWQTVAHNGSKRLCSHALASLCVYRCSADVA